MGSPHHGRAQAQPLTWIWSGNRNRAKVKHPLGIIEVRAAFLPAGNEEKGNLRTAKGLLPQTGKGMSLGPVGLVRHGTTRTAAMRASPRTRQLHLTRQINAP